MSNGIINFGPIKQKDINETKFNKHYILNSKFIEDNIDLIIWDFDNTLIDTQAYIIHSMEPDFIRNDMSIEQLENDMPYWNFFRSTVIKLVDFGKRVGIASFGMYNIIRAYMDRIFGFNQKYFTVINIYARCKIDEPLHQDKNEYIFNIMNYYCIKSPQRVMLIDDSSPNISAAIMVGIVGIMIDGIKYNNKGDKLCNGLFSPKFIAGLDKQLDSSLNNDNPLLISKLGHLGDRKVSINMYGRKNKCPPSLNKNKYINHDKKFKEPQYRDKKQINNNINNNKSITCDKCKISTPIMIIIILILMIILIITIYGIYNNFNGQDINIF